MPARLQRRGDRRRGRAPASRLAVALMTMSASGRWRPSSASGKATPPWRRPAPAHARACGWRPAGAARAHRPGARAASSMVSPAPISSTRGLVESREHLARQAHRGEGDRDRMRADAGVGAHALGHGEALLEQAVERLAAGCRRRARPARLPSPGRGSAARPAPSSPGRWRRETGAARPRRRRAGTGRLPARRRPGPGARASQRAGTPSCAGRDLGVDLGAIAGRQQRRFLDAGCAAQRRQRRRQRGGVERDALAQGERGGLVVQSEGDQGHGGSAAIG